MKKIYPLLFLLALSANLCAQKTDRKLQSKLREVVAGYNGDIGLFVKNINTGAVAAVNADTVFPTASIVKLQIFTGIIDKMRRGELNYDSAYTYKDSLLYEGEDILGSFKSNEKITLKKLIMLMLTTSDNTASLWLQSMAGKGTRINAIMDSIGLKDTRVNSRTPGREMNRARCGWGQTTPAEAAMLMEKIYRHQLFSDSLCDRMMRCLGRNFWDEDEGISRVPPTIEVFSKNGCVDASRSEVMLVNAPHHPYIFCIFTKNNKDTRWVHDNEAWVMARKISSMLWNYFEPGF